MNSGATIQAELFSTDIVNSDDSVSGWRPIHYLGSKLRALEALEGAVSSLSSDPQAHLCDLFAGSGTVANHFARSRPVTAIDIQEYSRVICSALLLPSPPLSLESVSDELEARMAAAATSGILGAAQPLVELEERAMLQAAHGDGRLLAALIETGPILTAQPQDAFPHIDHAMSETMRRLHSIPNISGIESMVLRHFGGAYFSFKQAAEIDILLDYAHSQNEKVRPILIAAILSTASEIVNTVGKHFAQPLRPRDKTGRIKANLFSIADRDRNKVVISVFMNAISKYIDRKSLRFNNRVLKSDYSDYINSTLFDADLVYADPPYTRDHYSRFYHVLETIALRDDPNVSTNTAHGRTVPSRGVYRADRHQSPFCIRSEAPLAFDTLFRSVSSRGVPMVLSYSPYASEKNAHPRVMTMDAVTNLAKRHFKKVEVDSVGTFSHSRLNRSDLNKEISYEAEYLLLCEA